MNKIRPVAPQLIDQMFKPKVNDPFKCKIIAYRGDMGACWYYRIHLPLSFLTKKNHDYGVTVAGVVSGDQMGKYDIAIFQRQYRQEVLDSALLLRKYGAKLVYEIDDDIFSIPEWSPAHKNFGKREQDIIKKFVSTVDAVFVTTEALKSVYSSYNNHIYVLPNSIAFDAHYPSVSNSKRKVVCWQGSNTHEKDLKIVSKAVSQLLNDADVMVKMWSADFTGTYNVPCVDFQSFHQLFSQVDAYIGLAPLVPCAFNRSKSNLKFLEYAAQGVATIASNFGPYAETIKDGETGFLVGDSRDWYDRIRLLLNDEGLYHKIKANALAFVKNHYDLDKNYILWLNAINLVQSGKYISDYDNHNYNVNNQIQKGLNNV